jgi:hypothetical protein
MTKISLRDVTLLSVSSVRLDDTQLALLLSSRHIEFGAVKLLSSGLPSRRANGIEYVAVAPMDLLGYSRLVLGQLHRHVETPHCLLVQADGFVADAGLWSPEFLEYDYVGAPWPEQVTLQPDNRILALDRNRVGNGGFSLRSRKLLQATAGIDFDALKFPSRSEDLVICHFLYDEMRAQGIRFAPVEVAQRFSIESPSLPGRHSTFGFHGRALLDTLSKDAGFRSDVAAATMFLTGTPGPGTIGRNDPCPCGSGRKYKRCHGILG